MPTRGPTSARRSPRPTPAEAIRELERAVELAPALVKAQFNLAVAYGAAPDHGSAKEIEQLRKVIELAPTFARAHLALGKALLGARKVPEAIRSLEEASRLDPQSGEAHYQLGLALARAGRRDEAEAALARGRELVSADDRVQHASLDVAEGRAALDRGDLDDAIGKFQSAIRRLPDSAEAHQQLGAALERRGDLEGATAAYRRALELSPGAAAAREALERLTPVKAGVDDVARMAALEDRIRAGQFQEVEPMLADYVRAHPTSSWGWYALGYSQFAQQKIGESLKSLAKSLQLDLTNAEAHKMLGRVLMIVGRHDAAQLEFELAIRYNPRSAESHYNLGRLLSIQDNWEPARRAFEAAVAIDPSYVEAIDGLGFALEALGDDEGAVAQYEKAVAINEARGGTHAAAHVNLSAFYNRTGDPGRALEWAAKALTLDPKSDRAWFQKGKAHELQGQLDDAVAAFNTAISANPRASSYYYVLSGVYRRMGWADESREALKVFQRLEEESQALEKKRRAATSAPPPVPPGRQRE
jgi:tetratricopeptide (TPR) repeat protein